MFCLLIYHVMSLEELLQKCGQLSVLAGILYDINHEKVANWLYTLLH